VSWGRLTLWRVLLWNWEELTKFWDVPLLIFLLWWADPWSAESILMYFGVFWLDLSCLSYSLRRPVCWISMNLVVISYSSVVDGVEVCVCAWCSNPGATNPHPAFSVSQGRKRPQRLSQQGKATCQLVCRLNCYTWCFPYFDFSVCLVNFSMDRYNSMDVDTVVSLRCALLNHHIAILRIVI